MIADGAQAARMSKFDGRSCKLRALMGDARELVPIAREMHTPAVLHGESLIDRPKDIKIS